MWRTIPAPWSIWWFFRDFCLEDLFHAWKVTSHEKFIDGSYTVYIARAQCGHVSVIWEAPGRPVVRKGWTWVEQRGTQSRQFLIFLWLPNFESQIQNDPMDWLASSGLSLKAISSKLIILVSARCCAHPPLVQFTWHMRIFKSSTSPPQTRREHV